MKKFSLLTIMFLSLESFAQDARQTIKVEPPKEMNTTVPPKKEDPEEIFIRVEIDAEFVGGNKALKDFLVKNLKASTPADKKAPKGNYTVIVRFIVDKKGNLSKIVAETDPGYGCAKEAVRVMKLSPKWRPGNQNGYVVNSVKRQPITFVVEL